ncbi:MAG TPA: uracil-DNA glycosylase family protein [Herpetosiphonaceae bacterium]|nr:uracil-DNA glycosylase family protein [Herpetosiphonaceae bacterium]
MDQPFLLAAGCVKCPRRVSERNHIVHGYGDPDARVMFVGTAPDSQGANQTGVPWTRSMAGQRMQTLLQAVRLRTLSDATHERPLLVGAYLTYLVRCASHADSPPSAAEVANCSAYLWREIELVNPRIIVPVGALPTRLLCAKLLHEVPGDVAEIHGHAFIAGQRILVPMIDIDAMTREEAQTFARVLVALLEEP